ncbi:MAG TPA: isoprenylcysteine carboxylmethyltransferase family protein [Holophagaceae bacterium]|nr:isoprenylcysteine carboxylmethyltransferase family protein [Holophagaceae bacterium]
MLDAIHRFLFPGLWWAWLIYWAVAARGVKAAQRKEGALSRLAHFGPLILAGWMLGADRLPGDVLGTRLWPRTEATFWIGAVLLAGGLGFCVWARRVIGRNWSGTVTVKEGHELVRTGPYALVRHPIYTGLLLAFAGTALVVAEARGVVAVLVVLLALWRKLRLEERWMGETFGEAYAAYRRETPALVPFLA